MVYIPKKEPRDQHLKITLSPDTPITETITKVEVEERIETIVQPNQPAP